MSMRRNIVFRVAIVYLLFIGLAIWILVDLFILKVVDADKWKSEARSVERGENIVEPNRGDILDAKGMKLATSVPSYLLYMDMMAEGLTDKKFNGHIDS